MPNQYWIKYPDEYKKCHQCNGSAYRKCTSCGGRGGKYRESYEYDYDGRRIIRDKWERCYACSGNGRQECFICGATGSIRTAYKEHSSESEGYETESHESTVSNEESSTPPSAYSLRYEFESIKNELQQRIKSCSKFDFFYKDFLKTLVNHWQVDTKNVVEQIDTSKDFIEKNYDAGNFEILMISTSMFKLSMQATLYNSYYGD